MNTHPGTEIGLWNSSVVSRIFSVQKYFELFRLFPERFNQWQSRFLGRKLLAILVMLIVTGFNCGCQKEKLFIRASGIIEVKEVDLSSRISSRVIELLYDEGTSVKKWDILAKLDDRIVNAQKETAEAIYEQARKNKKRNRNLFLKKSITEEQFEQAITQLIEAESNLKQKRIMIEEANIYAPWDGVILKKNVEVGELVSMNASILTLGDLTTAYVTIYVPLLDLGRVKLNQTARIQVDSFKNKYFEGRVSFISGEAEFTPKNVQTKDERIKEVFAVKIKVPNPDFDLKPGMPADVEIETK